jgi:hypothetical protein
MGISMACWTERHKVIQSGGSLPFCNRGQVVHIHDGWSRWLVATSKALQAVVIKHFDLIGSLGLRVRHKACKNERVHDRQTCQNRCRRGVSPVPANSINSVFAMLPRR